MLLTSSIVDGESSTNWSTSHHLISNVSIAHSASIKTLEVAARSPPTGLRAPREGHHRPGGGSWSGVDALCLLPLVEGIAAADVDLARLGLLRDRDSQPQHASGVVRIDLLGI